MCRNHNVPLLRAGGMPDLLLWRPGEAGCAKLVEVKGPRDRLSEQQRAWLLALMDVDVQVRAWVAPAGHLGKRWPHDILHGRTAQLCTSRLEFTALRTHTARRRRWIVAIASPFLCPLHH
jgi:hypothetical protein